MGQQVDSGLATKTENLSTNLQWSLGRRRERVSAGHPLPTASPPTLVRSLTHNMNIYGWCSHPWLLNPSLFCKPQSFLKLPLCWDMDFGVTYICVPRPVLLKGGPEQMITYCCKGRAAPSLQHQSNPHGFPVMSLPQLEIFTTIPLPYCCVSLLSICPNFCNSNHKVI